MKHPKPWFREANKTWYVCIRGKQEKLGTNKKEAFDAYHKLMASKTALVVDRTLTVESLKLMFLDWSKANHEPSTTSWYKSYLDSFCELDGTGKLKAFQVIPYHLEKWKTEHGYTTERGPVQIIKRLFAWADELGILGKDPLRKVKLPAVRSRIVLLSELERAEVLAAIRDNCFRNYVVALQETGARPGEVAKVTAEDVDLELGIWVLKKHKTSKKTKRDRVIYLSPRMIELTKAMMDKHPIGPLFPSMRRKWENGELVPRAYTKNAIRCRFRALREKLPHIKNLIAYSYRHSFATEALMKIGVAQVAELMGHSDVEMVSRHYGHLSAKVEHMREAARMAVS